MLLLRTTRKNGASRNDFKWPLKPGARVRCENWDPTPACTGGLYGLPWGEGDSGCLNWSKAAKWIVWEAPDDTVVAFERKAKAPRGIVRYVGNRKGATNYLLAHGVAGKRVVGAFVTCGDRSAAIGGNCAIVSGGYGAKVTGGDYAKVTGGDGATVTGGNGARLQVEWRDGSCYRLAVAYVGEDGIKAGVAYRVEQGRFVRKSSRRKS